MVTGKITSSRIVNDIDRATNHTVEKIETISAALEAMHFVYNEDYEGKPDIGYDLYDERQMWRAVYDELIFVHDTIEEFFDAG